MGGAVIGLSTDATGIGCLATAVAGRCLALW